MNIEDVRVPATDAFDLAATLYQPDRVGECRRFVLINSATAVKRRYYHEFANFLCSRGFAVLTFDYRGIGGSHPGDLRRFQASICDWAEKDISGVVDWIVKTHQPEKLLVIGHSVGGQLVGLVPNNDKITAMLTIAAQSGYWGLWPFPRLYLMALLWYGFMPLATSLFNYFPAKRLGLGEDLPGGVAKQWARWCRHPDYIVDQDGRPMRKYFKAFKGPIMSYSFDDDRFAPKAAVDFMAHCYANAPLTRRHLRPRDVGVQSVGHFGFFRTTLKEPLWRETSLWLSAQ